MTVVALFALSSIVFAQGSLKGRVVFEGTLPVTERVEVKSDTPVCGTHKEAPKIVLGKDQGVASAVVRVLGVEGAVQPGKGTLDQIGCEFVPHVQVLPVGSTLVITSSDAVLHNAHGFYEDGTTAFNIAVPIAGMEINKKLDKPGVIRLRCDAGHTWMSAYIVVIENSYYAMTGADGNFSIEGLPPGRYEVEVWQEWLGKRRQAVEEKDSVASSVILSIQ